MRFRTELDPHPYTIKIGHNDKILLLGSCFSDSIGQKLQRHKFQALVNPYGVLYHPNALFNNLQSAISDFPVREEHTALLDDSFVHFDVHSKIRASSIYDLATKITDVHLQVKKWIIESNFLFITLGTAFHFYHLKNERIVANCHKQPPHQFKRNLSSAQDIYSTLSKLIEMVRTLNDRVQIIFTISPVRHIRDGLIENNRSKAHLITAVHKSVEEHEYVHYFPAYELMLDDLRDYRFYSDDLIHPNHQAIEYIWQKFEQYLMTLQTQNLNQKIEKIQRSIEHKPFNEDSAAHRLFVENLIKDIETLSGEHDLNFGQNLAELKSRTR